MTQLEGAAGGEHFGAYRVLGVLGGGTGQVLRAYDAEHQRDVALKVLPARRAQDAGYRERFLREARIALRLTEPHVIPVHRYGEVDGRLFLDMRLVEGEDLASLLARTGPLDPARAVDLVGQVARALDAAHAVGLVHRDVTPSSVLLAARGDGGDLAESVAGEDVAYLLGLGIPRAADPPTGYLAPECITGPAPDGRADVFSLACVLFELLTGRSPFPGTDPAGAPLTEPPPAPSTLRATVPAQLDGVVLGGLSPDRGQRWTSPGGMAAAARAALAVHGIEVARPAGYPGAVGTSLPGGRARGWTAGRRSAAVAAVPVLAAILLGVRAWRGARRRRRSGR